MIENEQNTDQSGGINFGQGNRTRVGRDVVGRDSITGDSNTWEERQGSAASSVNVNFGENSSPKRQGESAADWIERALLGDPRMRQPGLIEELRNLSRQLGAYMEQDAVWKRNIEQEWKRSAEQDAIWKRNTEARIVEIERVRQTAISQPVAVLLLALCAMCVIVAIMLINYFGGGVG